MKKRSQYSRILAHLRRAGSRGATVRDLLKYTNYPSARLFEMESQRYELFFWGHINSNEDGQVTDSERIERTWKEVNGKRIRVYILRRI